MRFHGQPPNPLPLRLKIRHDRRAGSHRRGSRIPDFRFRVRPPKLKPPDRRRDASCSTNRQYASCGQPICLVRPVTVHGFPSEHSPLVLLRLGLTTSLQKPLRQRMRVVEPRILPMSCRERPTPPTGEPRQRRVTLFHVPFGTTPSGQALGRQWRRAVTRRGTC